MKKIVKVSLIGCGTILGLVVIAGIGLAVWFHHLQSNAGYAEDWNATDGQVVKDLAYGDSASNRFDLYIPAKASKTRPQALMLFIHGGSWTGGDKSEQEFACRRYAKMGYFTATMNYTLIGKDHPESSLMSMLREIRSCVAAIVAYTKAEGYRLDRMAVGGISAGGHLALLYGLKCADASPLPIAFVASRVGPTDLTQIFAVPDSLIQAVAADARAGREHPKQKELDGLLFNVSGRHMTPDMYTKQAVDSLLLAASPVRYVSAQSASVLMAYGEQDPIVRPVHARRLDSLLTVHRVPHHLVFFPHSGHMLGRDPGQARQFVSLVLQYCRRYFGY